jgi:hypothetical protein
MYVKVSGYMKVEDREVDPTSTTGIDAYEAMTMEIHRIEPRVTDLEDLAVEPDD